MTEPTREEPTREEEIAMWQVVLRAGISGLAFRGLGRDEIMLEVEAALEHHEEQARALEAVFGTGAL